MSIFPLFTATYIGKGRYAEVEINRNMLFRNALNKNSRTLKIKIKNTDTTTHKYLPVTWTGSQNWEAGTFVYVYPRNPDGTPAPITIDPGETKEIELDFDTAVQDPPNPDARYIAPALNVFVDDATTPDVVIVPLWVFDVIADKDRIAHINFNEIVKYGIMGNGSYQAGNVTVTQYIFAFDIASEDYIPVYAYDGVTKIDKGMIIAGSPITRNGGAVEISTITSQGPGSYSIKLRPVPSGYLKIGVDIMVDYSKMGDWLGRTFAWLVWITTDPMKYFLENPLFRYIAFAHFGPIVADLIAASNMSIDSYIDQNDPTKVHIVIYQYYNIDDPWWHSLKGILAVITAIGVIVGFVTYNIRTIEVTKAEVEKERIRAQKEMHDNITKVVLDPNIPPHIKLKYLETSGVAINATSQYTGLIPCKGVYIGNMCIEWWVFALAAGMLLLFLLLRK